MTTFAIALAGQLTAERVAKPGWWIPYAASGLVLLVTMCGTYYLCWALDRRDRHNGDSDDDAGGGGGGARRRDGPTPPRGAPDTDPEWWPEFERQFAHHVACCVAAGARATDPSA